MERTFRFRITADGLAELEKSLKDLGPAGEAAFKRLAEASPTLANALNKANEELDRTRGRLKELGESGLARNVFAQAQGAAEGFARGLGPVGAALGAMGPAGLAAAAALGLVGGALVTGAAALEKEEQGFRRLNAVLTATGSAAGVTAADIRALAEEVETSTLASGEAVTEAATRLAAFGGAGAAAFGDVVKRAQDMAAVFGGDVKANTEALAQALAKIDQGEVSSLRRSFGFLGAAALDAVEALAKTGATADAQQRFMLALQERVGGAGAAERGNTLTGAVKGLDKAWDDLLKTWGRATNAAAPLIAVINALRGATDFAAERAAPRSPLDDLSQVDRDIERLGNARNPAANRAQIEALQRRRAALFVLMAEQDEQARGDAATAAAGALAAKEERDAAATAARAAATAEVVRQLEREIELAGIATAERERTLAADKARAELLRANPQATADEIAQVVLLARQRVAMGQAEKERAENGKRILDALERAADEERRIWEAGEKLVEQDRKREAALADYIRGLEDEARLSGLSTREREVQKALLEAQAKLQRELTAEEAKRIRQAVEGKQANEEVRQRAEEAAKEVERVTGRSTDRIVDFAADAFDRLFDRQKGGWRDVWDFAVQSARKALAQIAAEAVVRPIVRPIVSGVVGAVMGGGGSGRAAGNGGGGLLGSLGGLFSSSSSISTQGPGLVTGIGDWINGATGILGMDFSSGAAMLATNPFASTGYALNGIAGALGIGGGVAATTGAAATYGISAGQAALLANSGALGAGALSPLAATGIGAAIALAAIIAMSAIGGKKSVGPNATAGLSYRDGSFIVGNRGADNGGDLNGVVSAMQGVADALNGLQTQYGVRPANVDTSNPFAPVVDPQGGGFGLGTWTYSTGDEVMRALIRRGALTGDGAIGTALAGRDYANDNELQLALQAAAAIDALANDNLSPLQQALEAVNAKFDELAGVVDKAGLSLAKLNEAREKELAATAAQQIGASAGGLLSLIDAYSFGQGAVLSPAQQLAELKAASESAFARAQDGSGSSNDFASAANAYLGAARSYYGGTTAYGAELSAVFGQVKTLLDREMGSTAQAILEGAAETHSLLRQVVKRLDALNTSINATGGRRAVA